MGDIAGSGESYRSTSVIAAISTITATADVTSGLLAEAQHREDVLRVPLHKELNIPCISILDIGNYFSTPVMDVSADVDQIVLQ